MRNISLKVGEYIRTAQGTIAQIEEDEFEIKTNIRGQLLYEKWIEGHRYYEVIVKHSPNLINIIQKDDFVNGEKVVDIFEIYDENEKLICKRLLTEYRKAQYNGTYRQYYIYEQDIKEVVTKEQFESISYKVKQEEK